MIQTVCINCGNKKEFNDDKLGKKFKCPQCGNIILIEKHEMETGEKINQDSNEKEISLKKSRKINPIALIVFVLILGAFFGIRKYLDSKEMIERQKQVEEILIQDSIAAANQAIKMAAAQEAEQAAADSAERAAQNKICLFTELSKLYDYKLWVFHTTDKSVTIWGLTIIDKSNNEIIKTIYLQINGIETSLDCSARSYITGFNKDVEAMDGDYGSLVINDFNFDGLEDIAVKTEMNNTGGHYSYFLQTLNHDYISDSFLTDSISGIPTLDYQSKTLNWASVIDAGYISERKYKYDVNGTWVSVSETLKRIGD